MCDTNNPASKACHSGGLAAKNLWKGIPRSSQHEKGQIEEQESGVEDIKDMNEVWSMKKILSFQNATATF